VIAALVFALASADVAPLPTVPAHPAWCAKRMNAALSARSPGVPYRLTALRREGVYAYAGWTAYTAGGEATFVRTGDGWCVLGSGGGAMALPEVIASGVPREIAQRLFRSMHPQAKRT
jgi:hypothetical protein